MFEGFQKIPRLNRECTITEKIDGTNAQVWVELRDVVVQQFGVDGQFTHDGWIDTELDHEGLKYCLCAGSRNKLITPGDDNHGFARWVNDNKAELVRLGPGRHFGEWWGSGIQKSYGLTKGEKRWSLFNTHKWTDDATRPKCCHVVPVLFKGPFATDTVQYHIEKLRSGGSVASPGFMKPEGLIVWHDAAQVYFKVTLERDESPKGLAA